MNNKLIGDPLDVSMFEATDWILDEPSHSAEPDDQLVIAYVYPREMNERHQKYLSNTESDASAAASSGSFKNALIRRFDFASGLQRMSVLCKNSIDGEFRAFVKGSPEKI